MPTSPKPIVKSRWGRGGGWEIQFPKTNLYFACTWFENTPAGVAAAIRAWRRDGPKGLSKRDREGYPTWPRDILQFGTKKILGITVADGCLQLENCGAAVCPHAFLQPGKQVESHVTTCPTGTGSIDLGKPRTSARPTTVNDVKGAAVKVGRHG
jgi:hypothetical protein